jgi:hypothetical protein
MIFMAKIDNAWKGSFWKVRCESPCVEGICSQIDRIRSVGDSSPEAFFVPRRKQELDLFHSPLIISGSFYILLYEIPIFDGFENYAAHHSNGKSKGKEAIGDDTEFNPHF